MSLDAMILCFAEAAEAGPSIAGGKGVQLGRMQRYGLPVPDGFVLSAPLLADAFAALMTVGDISLATPAELAAQRTRLAAMPLPATVQATLAAELAARNWLNRPLAVRSSAAQEDARHASFAGIFESVLNVTGIEAVCAAIQTVYASQWTPAAQAYRQRLGLVDMAASMAVVIMPMVPAKAAGVAFSCDPRSGRDDQVVINATRGLADKLVSGHVSGEVITLQLDRVTDTFDVLATPDAATADAILTRAQALALAELVRDTSLALDYGAPWFDIEWVWDGERFHLVQARPVTVRPWHTYAGLAGQPCIWSNGNTRDVVPDVLDACDWVFARRMVNLLLEQGYRVAGYSLLAGAQRAALFQGRLYLNAAFIQWEGFDALGVPTATMNRLLGGHQSSIHTPAPTWRDRLSRLGRMLRYMVKAGRVRRTGQQRVREAHASCAAQRAEALDSLSAEQLAQRLAESNVQTAQHPELMFLQGSGGGGLAMLVEQIEKYLPGEGYALASALMAGGEPSVTAQQSYDLATLAAAAAQDPVASTWLRAGESDDWAGLPVGNAFRQAFSAFLDRYGHRGVYESYLRNPRWREAPGYLLRQITSLMDHDGVAWQQRQVMAQASARQRLAIGVPWLARVWINTLVKVAKRECNDREAARSAFTAYSELARRLLLAVGQRLMASGHLYRVDQVFQLTPHEAMQALRGTLAESATRHRVADRERLSAEWQANPAAEVVLEGAAAMSAVAPSMSTAASDCWQGIAVGAGVATGRGRIIRHPSEGAALAQGDILVAPSTDPAWTPLFLRAGGLVMETGGFLSHGAIVAREFGIPAVVNLPGILDRLCDGGALEVDGQRGTVRRMALGAVNGA